MAQAEAEVVEQQSPSQARRDEQRPPGSPGSPGSPGAVSPQGAPAAPQGGQPPQPAPRQGLPRRFRVVAVVALAVLALAGVLYWLHSRQYEDTDDATVDGHIHPISARINGTVAWVNPQVEENKFVAAGTV
ncbi:MAG: hypothetical protein JOZ15_18875, partial [Acidobacteria bacterium]|nr:hypothetical protein [Acidobacteriota bacterium]